jgi:HSP20 family protein
VHLLCLANRCTCGIYCYVLAGKKGGIMTLIKRSNWPALMNDNWLTDFVDNNRFFDADWMKRLQEIPAVNVKEKNKEFLIELAAPGLKKDDFKITIENGILTIMAEREEEKEMKEENFTRKEFSYENFVRSFNLPENAMEDKVDAHYENGILLLKIAKKEIVAEKKRKAIAVH